MRIRTRLFMWIALLCMTAQGAWADGVQYKYRSWNEATKTVVEETRTCNTYTEITNDPEHGMEINESTWLVVKGSDVKIPRIVIYSTDWAEVHIILCDGAKLTTYISFKETPCNLHIYGQSEGTGELVADASKIGYGSAGIGGIQAEGFTYLAGKVYLHGGNIKAWGSKYGAGIGGTRNGSGGNLTVYGGSIEAHGGDFAAGIGGGQNGDGASVTVYGGTVRGYGGDDAAGIGSGEQQSGTRNGGSLTVYGGTVFGDGTGWGAGIGGGEDSDGADVKVYGGTVSAWAGADAADKNGCAIGSEDGDGHRGTLTLGATMMVHAGKNPDSKSLFPKNTRVPACFFRPYAIIEPCTHTGSAYTVTGTTADDTHSLVCNYCEGIQAEKHNFAGGTVCTVCHVQGSTNTISIYLPEKNGGNWTDGHYAAAVTQKFVTNAEFNLPAAPTDEDHLPEGYTFAGWFVGDPTTTYRKGDDAVLAPGSSYQVTANVSFTARYIANDIILADNADNDDILMANDGKKAVSVKLAGRTLYKDGSWNTLCLPFNVIIAGSPLDGDGVDVRKLGSTSFADGKLTLTFTTAGNVTELVAGEPYLIKWNNTGENIVEPVFTDKVIESETTPTEKEWVAFVGTFSPSSIYQAGDYKTNLYLAPGNKLYYPTNEGFKVNSCRAHFKLLKSLYADATNGGAIVNPFAGAVREFILDFGDGEATSIHLTPSLIQEDGVWFTLDGIRMSGKPTQRGLYINNGRKIIIK